MNLNLRTRIFAGILISLLLLAIIPLASCTEEMIPPCTLLSSPEDIDAWLEGQDGFLDYRGDLDAWTSTSYEDGETRIIGHALSEDSNIWDARHCRILDLH